MKICHMTSAHDSTDPRIFYKECTSLAKNGHDVTLVACGDSREENGVHVVGVGKKPESRIKRIVGFSKKVYKTALAVNADVYHLHDPELLPYVRKLQRKGKRVIFDSHENTLGQMYEKKWIPKIFRKTVGDWYKRYATKVFRRVDALISVTPHIVDMLSYINRNSYMVTNFPIIDEKAEIQLRKKEKNKFILCFTGGINRDWGHKTIIDCIKQIPDCQYVLCGKADMVYLSELKSLQGWENVDFFGKVSMEDALGIQKTSNVGMALLAPSSNTNGMNGTIGNTKIFEYMLAGIPLICTCFDLWKDIIDEYKCGICVDPTNMEDVIHAIMYLKSHEDEAADMGKNGFRAVKEKYNWRSQEAILNTIYTNMETI